MKFLNEKYPNYLFLLEVKFIKWIFIFMSVGLLLDIINLLFNNPIGIYDRGYNCLTFLSVLFPLNFILWAFIYLGIHMLTMKFTNKYFKVTNKYFNFLNEIFGGFFDIVSEIWYALFPFFFFVTYIIILLDFFIGNLF